jgi:hypothetical protein
VKQDKLLIVLVVLLVIAGLVWLRYFKGDNGALTAAASTGAQNAQIFIVDNPRLRLEEITNARKTEYKSNGRNIFVAQAAPPVVVALSKPKPVPGPQLPSPDPPPKVALLPAKFFGYGTIPNGTARVAFFNDGEDVYVVKEGELLLNRFRILKIGNANLEYEEISSGLRGTAPLEEQAAPGGPSA